MDSPPLWVFDLSFQGFFVPFNFLWEFLMSFWLNLLQNCTFKKNPFLVSIKLSTHNLIWHLFCYFQHCWSKICWILEFSPGVWGFFPLRQVSAKTSSLNLSLGISKNSTHICLWFLCASQLDTSLRSASEMDLKFADWDNP